MFIESSQAYFEWLRQRGLAQTPVVETTGVFVRELAYENSILILSDLDASSYEEDAALLRRLAAAVGPNTSIAAASAEAPLPVQALISAHSHLLKVIILGDLARQTANHSGISLAVGRYQVVYGPSPATLRTDLAAKREFWGRLQNNLH